MPDLRNPIGNLLSRWTTADHYRHAPSNHRLDAKIQRRPSNHPQSFMMAARTQSQLADNKTKPFDLATQARHPQSFMARAQNHLPVEIEAASPASAKTAMADSAFAAVVEVSVNAGLIKARVDSCAGRLPGSSSMVQALTGDARRGVWSLLVGNLMFKGAALAGVEAVRRQPHQSDKELVLGIAAVGATLSPLAHFWTITGNDILRRQAEGAENITVTEAIKLVARPRIFTRGLLAAAARDGIYTTSFPLYWTFYQRLPDQTKDLYPLPAKIISSALAGATAAGLSQIPEAISGTQLNVPANERALNALEASQLLYQSEGLRGFTRSLVPRIKRIARGTAVITLTLEGLSYLRRTSKA